MNYKIVSHNNVTLSVHKGETVTPGYAGQAVRLALSKCGYAPWGGMRIDLFQGRGDALLLARPVFSGKEPKS